MAKPILLSISLCLFVLFQGSLALVSSSQQQNECRIDRINAREPDSRIQSEAGTIESWDPNHDQFRCAGVAVTRHTIQPDGLLLPAYSNAPQLVYIVQGQGMLGAMFPGCAETFQESQESSRSSRQQEQHQKIRHFRRGDVIALPAGIAHWCYNDGNEPLIAVSVLDTGNNANQLDRNPRNFYLAGNPEDEFQQQSRRPGERGHGEYSLGGSSERRQRSCNNVFCGMDSRFIAEAFNIDEQLARRIQGQDDARGNIVRVEGRIQVTRPPRTQQEREEQLEREYEQGRRHYNGIEETFCTMRMRENIADPSRADIFVPEVGRMSTVNSHSLPILRWLKLSASHAVLRNNAVRLPHWHMNSHSILYAIRGQARIQVVNENGNSVFDGSVRQGQVLTLPQNFVVVNRAESDNFEYVSFNTNDNAVAFDVAGRTSALRGMPVEVIANAFRVSIEEARRIKFGREETTLGSSLSQPRRAAA
ncbi:11S globulin seed storage protein 1 [Ricinus communis]|uniref:Legumin A, putative n=1 Tax=Ricinus communis TaxID=3988 RepID=B9SF35_RICCO|nr:11S globulin seed storage protein 1 [Ricinus communis]EEF37812.1 legumin A precursor, putative [Ricinus communis]|eukprot:XP_002524604.1 legumin A [Ricinus communis]